MNGKRCRLTETPKPESSKRTIPIPEADLAVFESDQKRSTSKYVIWQGNQIIPVHFYLIGENDGTHIHTKIRKANFKILREIQ